jgi:regulator of protease activity HflC (stomatin/prohibitin superfamily)
VGPEFRTAIRGMFARHSYLGLQQQNEKLEDEIEEELRRRINGKHVEISSVTMEEIVCAQEIVNTVQARLVAEQERLRRNAQLAHEQEVADMRANAELKKKKHDQEMADAQAAMDRARVEAEAEVKKVEAETEATTKLTRAKADAQAISLLAKAHADEKRAESIALTPLAVMMHAYDALGKLGGENTTFLFGDYSKVPQFLFPRIPAFQNMLGAPLASLGAAKR